MTRQTSLLPAAGLALAVITLGVQFFWIRTERLAAEQTAARLRRDLGNAETRLHTAEATASRLAERSESTSPAPLSPAEERETGLRAKLAEIVARHRDGIAALPPAVDPIGRPNTAAENLADPAFAALYRDWYRPRLEKEYNALLVALPVTAEAKALLSALLMEQQMARMDLIAASGASRWGPANDPTPAERDQHRRAQMQQEEKFRAEIRSLLGEEAYRHFERLDQRRAGGGFLAANFIQRISYSDTPLSAEQRNRLLEISAQPDFQSQLPALLSTKQMEQVREYLRDRELMQGRPPANAANPRE